MASLEAAATIMTKDELRTELARLALSQVGLARLLHVDERTVRRWVAGQSDIPRSVELLLPLLKPTDIVLLMAADRDQDQS
jgi:DNA-binding transcriptional regulator YiaG